MSADTKDSWKLTLPCTRAEAEALEGDVAAFVLLDSPPVLMTSEASPDDENIWQLDAYFEGRPNTALVKLVQTLVPSARGKKPTLEKLAAADWVTISQQGLAPVTAGRFFVRNSPQDAVPPGYKDFLIGAGLAFGTGQHETTAGCLAMLDRTCRLGHRFGNIADIGTGTGLLAFAAMHLWPMACCTASDIDPVSIDVTAENAHKNGVRIGHAPGRLALVTAAGVEHPALAARAPYDLLIANILAGPLIELAPSLVAHIEDGGTLILAGLLDTQADRVIAAYRAQGMRIADRINGSDGQGQWPTLRLRKRPAIGWRRPRRWNRDRNGEAPGYGSI